MKFEKYAEFWLAHSSRLKGEHKTYKQLLDNLTEELKHLTEAFAQRVGWQNVSGQVPKYPGTKKTRDGRRRAKTALEQLSSTDDSDDEEESPGATVEAQPQTEGTSEGGGDIEFEAVMKSIGMMGGNPEALNPMTERTIGEHVREFVRERLNPTSKIKDALAWWAAKEASWPMVAAVARHSLCVPAAAACSERGFSATGHIVRARRSRLTDEKVAELSHLSNNLDAHP